MTFPGLDDDFPDSSTASPKLIDDVTVLIDGFSQPNTLDT